MGGGSEWWVSWRGWLRAWLGRRELVMGTALLSDDSIGYLHILRSSDNGTLLDEQEGTPLPSAK